MKAVKNKRDKNQRFFHCNFFPKNRKGQFYLIAAIVIIAAIVTLFTISNYLIEKESIKLYDLGEELGVESQYVLDYGVYSEKSENEMQSLAKTFIGKYITYVEEGKDIYFIFGNRQTINVVGYGDFVKEDVIVNIGEGLPTSLTPGVEISGTGGSSNIVVITIDATEYDFKLKPGENFYFVLSQEISGEKYIVTSKDKTSAASKREGAASKSQKGPR